MVGVELRRVDRLLEVQAEIDVPEEHVQRPLLLLVSAGRSPCEVRARPRAARDPGTSVVRGLAPGVSEEGSPSSSQNICARVPSGHPRAGITGDECSQPPLGVTETRFPKRSATSRCTVSPCVGSPDPAVAATSGMLGRWPRPGAQAAADVSPTRVRRSSVVVGGEQGVERHFAVAVERVAVGERELRALRYDVDELRVGELGEVEALEQGELLEAHRTRAPRLRLADGQPAVVER